MKVLLFSSCVVVDKKYKQHAPQSFCVIGSVVLTQTQHTLMKYLYNTMIVSLTRLHFIKKISWTPTKAIQDKTSKAKRVLPVSAIITCIARTMSSQMCHIFCLRN